MSAQTTFKWATSGLYFKALGIQHKLRSRIGFDWYDQEIEDHTIRFRTESRQEYIRAKYALGERKQLEWFIQNLEPSDFVWDVGAAVGTYTCFAASKCRRVVAFEPHPVNAERLQENLDTNGLENVTIAEMALSDEKGETELLDFSSGELSEAVGLHRLGNGEDNRKTIPIKQTIGDSLPTTPTAVKIDVEGAELQVLEGMKKKLDDVRLILIECHPQHGITPVPIKRFLDSHDFDIDVSETTRSEQFVRGMKDV